MPKKSGTKSYSAEFREKAVRLVTERGYTIKQVAERLECSEELGIMRMFRETEFGSAEEQPNQGERNEWK
ncbi:MAG: transposase [Planctomycetaceae bacterium]|jgi:transposase-like protein|nr:transposase [Planctomycetaceae bacterium]